MLSGLDQDHTEKDRLPYLDGLRGVAILLVLTNHYLYTPYNPSRHPGSWFVPVHRLLEASWCGVDLFFVLSGFLLGGILMDHRRSENLFAVFYLRRTCRILPAYWLFLSPLALVPLLGLGHRFPALADWASTGEVPAWVYPLFLQNLAMAIKVDWGEAWITPTWSLAVEEQFYLLLPLLIRYMPAKRLPVLLIALAFTAPVLRILLHMRLGAPAADLDSYTLLPCRWDSLLLGVFVAWLIRNRGAIDWMKARIGVMYGSGLLLAAAAMALAIFSPRYNSVPVYSFGYTLFAVFFSVVILYCMTGPSVGRKLLEWAPLRRIGRISFMLYLVHVPLSALVFHVVAHRPRELDNAASVGLMAVSFLASLAFAAVSWKFFERPILTFAWKFKYAEPATARP